MHPVDGTEGITIDRRTGSFRFARRILLVTIVGLVQALCFPPVGWAYLLPICLAAFLLLLTGLDVKQAFRLGFVYGLAWYLGDLFWLARIFGPAAVSLCAIMAFFTGLFGGLLVWLQVRIPRVPYWLLTSAIWTGIEYFRSELFILKFGWLGLGYAVVNAPILAFAASWLGCYGLTFMIMALAVILGSPPLARRAAASGRLPYGWSKGETTGHNNILFRFGAAELWLVTCHVTLPAPAPMDPLRVRLVQAPSEDDESFFTLSRASAGSPAHVIVWPEYSFASDPTRQPRLWARIVRVARENNAYLLFGAKNEIDSTYPAAYRNTAYLIDPEGELAGTHVKNHTVHFFRDGVPGTTARAIDTRLGRLGVAICFDMDYPDVARRLVEDGATLFLVPNDDPPEWGPVQRVQHRLMFQMRAVECGRWLARADVAGGTSVALPNGGEATRIGATGPGTLEAVVGRERSKTVFILGGWRFGPLCLVALACFVGLATVHSWRDRQRSRSSPVSKRPASDL